MLGEAVTVQIRAIRPPAGVLVGVQSGSGNSATTVLSQRTDANDLVFRLELDWQERDGRPYFKGRMVQKDSKGQFIYLRWGKIAGEAGSCIARRTKVYLGQVTLGLVRTGFALNFEGTAKDGLPACATVPVTVSPL